MAAWAARRLARDANLVACPDCGWYQSDRVRAARRRWARRTLHAAWLVPLLAALPVTGVCGYEMSGGTGRVTYAHLTSAEQRRVLMAVVVAIAAVVLVPSGRWLLSRVVDPNRAYPDRPAPIPGGPTPTRLSDPTLPPVAVDAGPDGPAAGGVLGYARREPDVLPGGWVTVQLLGLTCPPTCARCLGPTTRVRTFGRPPLG